MHVAFKYFIIALVLVGCAQVKSLEGGPVDQSAPIPLAMVPKNQMTNFKGNAIAVAFDEYVKLNNPIQSISIMPNDVKVQSELKDKTLMLYWGGDLRENTTYSIFLNKTIKDITEANDSIIQIVFSTGSVIDSLEYSSFVVDAISNQAIGDVVVGLFDHSDSLKPIYFSQTDKNGKVKFRYLKAGDYYVRAFKKQTLDGKIDLKSPIAFKKEAVHLTENQIDSIPLRMFQSLLEADLTTVSYQKPIGIIVGANRSLEFAKFKINDTLIPKKSIKFYEKDSLLLLRKLEIGQTHELTIQSEQLIDTARFRVSKTKDLSQKWTVSSKTFQAGDTLKFYLFDQLKSLDSSLIQITNENDSSKITNYHYFIEGENTLCIVLPSQIDKFINLKINSKAVSTASQWPIEQFQERFEQLTEKELGVLTIQVKGYQSSIVLEVMLNGKKIKLFHLDEDKTIRLDGLLPGVYTFRILVDENDNGKWDTGDFEQKKQAEKYHYYTKSVKLRANWEMEVELIPDE